MTQDALYDLMWANSFDLISLGDGVTIDEISIPQASTSQFHLVCKRNGEAVSLDKEVLIGRELDCTVRLTDAQIRRYHAKITVSDDGLFLEDLNAKNSTYLNGSRIGTGAWITLGDEINLDGIRFCVEAAKPSNIKATQTSVRESAVEVQSPYRQPEMPFSNQDVVEATRALEERAKARLQLFKASEEGGKTPNWEEFIAKRFKEAPSEKADVKASTQELVEATKEKSPETEATPTPIDLPNSISDFDQAFANFDAANDAESESPDEGLLGTPVFTEQLEPEPVPVQIEARAPKSTRSAVYVGSGPRLIVKTAPLRGKVYALAATDAKTTWTIGRAGNADVYLDELEIDLIHAHIEQVETGFKIRTTRSTNGMLINGILKNEVTLNHGDSIQFGRTEFQFAANTKASLQKSPNNEPKHQWNVGFIAATVVVLGALLVALVNSTL